MSAATAWRYCPGCVVLIRIIASGSVTARTAIFDPYELPFRRMRTAPYYLKDGRFGGSICFTG